MGVDPEAVTFYEFSNFDAVAINFSYMHTMHVSVHVSSIDYCSNYWCYSCCLSVLHCLDHHNSRGLLWFRSGAASFKACGCTYSWDVLVHMSSPIHASPIPFAAHPVAESHHNGLCHCQLWQTCSGQWWQSPGDSIPGLQVRTHLLQPWGWPTVQARALLKLRLFHGC